MDTILFRLASVESVRLRTRHGRLAACLITTPNMEPEGRYTIIGMLLLVLAATAVWAGIWLTGQVGGAVRYYTIYFERQSLLLVPGSVCNRKGPYSTSFAAADFTSI